VLKVGIGDEIRRDGPAFLRLSEAYFEELQRKFS